MRQPDIDGMARAWRADVEGFKRKHPDIPEEAFASTMCSWYVSAPWAHPLWSWYNVVCIALRDMPGVPKAQHIHVPGATHEMWVAALNPEHPVALDESPHMLRPMNFAAQWVAASDAEARKKVEEAVADICRGVLNPDTDFRGQWVARFGGGMMKGGWQEPDQLIVQKDGSVTVIGTGAGMVQALDAMRGDKRGELQ